MKQSWLEQSWFRQAGAVFTAAAMLMGSPLIIGCQENKSGGDTKTSQAPPAQPAPPSPSMPEQVRPDDTKNNPPPALPPEAGKTEKEKSGSAQGPGRG